MKRKTIQLAENTLVVSLPAKWVKEHSIAKGDELEVEMQGPMLIVGNERKKQGRIITLDARQLNERALRWSLSALHKKGYDEITVEGVPGTIAIVQDMVKNLLTGFAIVDQRKQSCTLRAIATEDPNEFDAALRRAFLVTLTMGERIAEVFEEGGHEALEGLKELEKTNNQLTNFCERLINKKRVSDELATFHYVIAWNLEKIADEYKYIIEEYRERKSRIGSKELNLLKKTNQLLRGYYEVRYSFDHNRLKELSELAKEIAIEGKDLFNNSKEHILIHHMLKIAGSTADFSSSIVALHR